MKLVLFTTSIHSEVSEYFDSSEGDEHVTSDYGREGLLTERLAITDVVDEVDKVVLSRDGWGFDREELGYDYAVEIYDDYRE